MLGDRLGPINQLASAGLQRLMDQSFMILDLTLGEAPELSAWFEPSLSNRRWCASQSGDIAAVAAANNVERTEVLLRVSPIIARWSRWFCRSDQNRSVRRS